MERQTFLVLASILACSAGYPVKPYHKHSFELVCRADWGANPSGPVTMLEEPASYVVIHHTYQPGVCKTRDSCVNAMQDMQQFHQNGNGWSDIGYNFAIGGEGRVYEGRGWEVVGAHAVGYNSRSVGIAIIGDWRSETPSKASLKAVRALIETGVKLGYIEPTYTLMGHRQASSTECPGDALFNEISTWPRFRKA
ncbi:hypothetical protein evm_007863 [Chilo suppressalis]|nr:hypothetical protein evm_007863 [Chilo suppressalis]